MSVIQIGSDRYFCCDSSVSDEQQQRQKHHDCEESSLRACLADGSMGPIVGRVMRARRDSHESVNNDTIDDDTNNNKFVELDPVGFGGEYVGELVYARPVISSSLPPLSKSFLPQRQHGSRSDRTEATDNASLWKSLRRQLDTNGILVWSSGGDGNDGDETGARIETRRNQQSHQKRNFVLPNLAELEAGLHKKRDSLFGNDSGQSTHVRSDRIFFVSSWPGETDENVEEDWEEADSDEERLSSLNKEKSPDQ